MVKKQYYTTDFIIDENKLTEILKIICKYNWGFESTISCVINSRLINTTGNFEIRYEMKDGKKITKPVQIALSKEILTSKYKIESMVQVLEHECAHYYLYQLNKKFSDGSRDFKNELNKFHIIDRFNGKKYGYYYNCEKCNRENFMGRKKQDIKRTLKKLNGVSKCCKANLINLHYDNNDNFIDRNNYYVDPNLLKKIYEILKK